MAETGVLEVAKVFEENVFRRFGAPSLVRHDRDPRFMSEVFQKFSEMMQSRSKATLSYRPQANGQQERSVKTMIQTVRVYVEDPLQADWDDISKKMVYAINNSRDSTRQETPFYLVIEAHHRAIKLTAVNHVLAAMGHAVVLTLPKLQVKCAMGFGSDPIRHFVSGPVFADILEKSLNLCEDANHHPRHPQSHTEQSLNLENITSTQTITVSEIIMRIAFRAKVYARSLHGTLRANEAVENVQLRYLSLHCVEIRVRIAYAHDWNSSAWSHDAVQTILKTRTYRLAYISLMMEVMLHELPALKLPGRPRKKNKCLVRDRVRQSQYSVDALISRLVDKAVSAINWSVLMVKTTATEDGERLSLPFDEEGSTTGMCSYGEGDEITPLEAEELARVINFSFQLDHTIVP
ncbi:Hypothetical protein PHPALM_37291 [Phytophthora palmivora]|uniref:Integrase catalytic domain-containing protein n=1 Tax=Phytophthora palmivora TaxID=4796 RepID=A0A2P4WXU1_9STRA|nr:Hypothetical protein PHPALM_37291 [Phytophthora palmivora]